MAPIALHRYIDQAVLQPHTTRQKAREEIESGIRFEVRTVCVRPCDLELALDMCQGSQTDVCAVLDFPHGVGLPAIKQAQAKAYCELGVPEIDMVANYGLIRSGEWDLLAADIHAVSEVTRAEGTLLKVILETSELTDEWISKATQIAAQNGADFVKTSTGFASGGATKEAVALMLQAADGHVKVKASGGIRDLSTAYMYIQMGCERLGIGSTTVPLLLSNSETVAVDPY